MGKPRIAVVGAGRVGCYVGGNLARAAQVTLIGRAPTIDAIAAHGLTVVNLKGQRTVTPASDLTLATEPSAVAGASLVLITTKAADTFHAVQQIAPFLRAETVLVSLQNGLRNSEVIDEALESIFPSRAERPLVLRGMVPFNVVSRPDATYVQTTSGTIVVMDHPRIDPFVDAAERAGLTIHRHPDMRAVLAAKLLLNLNNAINALSGLSLREELLDRDYRRVLAACQEEALAVMRVARVRPSKLTPLPPRAMPTVLRTPTPVFVALSRAALAIGPGARSSMADDLDSGRPTEIDELQGAIVRLGEQHHVATPVCRRVTELVREAEAAGPQRIPWTGKRLRKAVTS